VSSGPGDLPLPCIRSGASLMVGAAVAWLMAVLGGQHRDGAIAPYFWRRWEVDRFFVVR